MEDCIIKDSDHDDKDSDHDDRRNDRIMPTKITI